MNHKDLVDFEKQGKVLIGVDQTMARKFYIHMDIKQIENETGERPYFERIIVVLALLAGPSSLLASLFLGFWFFGWWGIICLIPCPIIYFRYSLYSFRGDSKIVWINILLLASACLYFFDFFKAPQITGLTTIFVFSLWSVSFLYYSSTTFLRNFILRNERAYQYLLPYIVLKTIE